ncbi:NLP/P60-like protein, partial [Pseudomonas coronafaciens pv. garcae]
MPMQVVRFAPLVPLALVTFLFGCSANMPVAQQEQVQPAPHYQNTVTAQSAARRADAAELQDEMATEDELAQFADNKSYKLPVLADSILERGK